MPEDTFVQGRRLDDRILRGTDRGRAPGSHTRTQVDSGSVSGDHPQRMRLGWTSSTHWDYLPGMERLGAKNRHPSPLVGERDAVALYYSSFTRSVSHPRRALSRRCVAPWARGRPRETDPRSNLASLKAVRTEDVPRSRRRDPSPSLSGTCVGSRRTSFCLLQSSAVTGPTSHMRFG